MVSRLCTWYIHYILISDSHSSSIVEDLTCANLQYKPNCDCEIDGKGRFLPGSMKLSIEWFHVSLSARFQPCTESPEKSRAVMQRDITPHYLRSFQIIKHMYCDGMHNVYSMISNDDNTIQVHVRSVHMNMADVERSHILGQCEARIPKWWTTIMIELGDSIRHFFRIQDAPTGGTLSPRGSICGIMFAGCSWVAPLTALRCPIYQWKVLIKRCCRVKCALSTSSVHRRWFDKHSSCNLQQS